MINFIGDKRKAITKEEADSVVKAWQSGAKCIVLGGEVFATHQIVSIVDRREHEWYSLQDDLVKYGYLPEGEDEDILKKFRNLKSQLVIGSENNKLLN